MNEPTKPTERIHEYRLMEDYPYTPDLRKNKPKKCDWCGDVTPARELIRVIYCGTQMWVDPDCHWVANLAMDAIENDNT